MVYHIHSVFLEIILFNNYPQTPNPTYQTTLIKSPYILYNYLYTTLILLHPIFHHILPHPTSSIHYSFIQSSHHTLCPFTHYLPNTPPLHLFFMLLQSIAILSIKLEGVLPLLQLNISDNRIQNILELISGIEFPSSAPENIAVDELSFQVGVVYCFASAIEVVRPSHIDQ